MNKKLIIMIAFSMLWGCHSTVELDDALRNVEETTHYEPTMRVIKWFDTKKTCSIKLSQSNDQIIILKNRLDVTGQQIKNIRISLESGILDKFRGDN